MSSDEDEEMLGRPRLGLGAKRKQDAALGVFGDDDDDEAASGGGGRGGGGRRPFSGLGRKMSGRGGSSDSKPMAFVSGGSSAAAPEAARASGAEASGAAAARTGGASNDDFRSMLSGAPPPPAKPVAAPPVAPSFGAAKATAKAPEWMKHTKGVGFAMLQKMGFSGRLGKEETGVSRHVEVCKRPEGMGLGFAAKKGFKEESSLPANVELQRELGHDVPETAEEAEERVDVDARRAKRRRQFKDGASMATAVAQLDRAVAQNRRARAQGGKRGLQCHFNS